MSDELTQQVIENARLEIGDVLKVLRTLQTQVEEHKLNHTEIIMKLAGLQVLVDSFKAKFQEGAEAFSE